MDKVSKKSLLCLLMSLGFASLSSNALAENVMNKQSTAQPPQSLASHMLPSASALDVADDSEDDIGDHSENDSANDYDSIKENESEDTALTQEEEDNSLLDEDGNVTQSSDINPLKLPAMPKEGTDSLDK